jgi:uroporphyrinogen-III synthase
MSLSGLKVLSLESRRATEIETLIRKQGGEPFVAPSVKERPLTDHSDAFRLLERLEKSEIEMLILTTGVGLSFWREVVGPERADAALRKTKLLARGPKPVAVLRLSGIGPEITIPEPNTWREIVSAMRGRSERKLAVQEYGRKNEELVGALAELGATVETYALYRWELPDDTAPLREAAHRLARAEADLVLFTSGVQLDHLFTVADEERIENEVQNALTEQVVIASIGPIMNEALASRGLKPDIVPDSPKMGPLVYAVSEQAVEAIRRKRAGSSRLQVAGS